MAEENNKENIIIECPNKVCKSRLRIPKSTKTLRITCPKCGTTFLYPKQTTNNKQPSRMNRKLLVPLLILVTVFLAGYWFISQDEGTYESKILQDNWIKITYGNTLDNSILTHSGENIGEAIKQIPEYDDSINKGLVQPYLEPYSILCHDVLLYFKEPDTQPLVNILAHYPIGSEQPAWVDLFREGHFQLYYNENLVRLFLKGDDPEISFEKYQSVVRHPIEDILNDEYLSIENIEVYVFENDYSKTEIKVNTTPAILVIDEIDLSPKRRPLDLESIEDFLNQGVSLKAIEVDEDNDLFFYGKEASNQTVAGQPLSISDIAVIYRAIFHHGYNEPYISLDAHEDNRYAKVNFGGYLENTRVGHVLLEADKLFKLLSTGMDPNTYEMVKSKITEHVPDFLTEDERNFLEDSMEGSTQIRYWFYPDEIGTVTDGSIGVVETYQFLADAERMDFEVDLDRATRETIEHLNENYSQYLKAHPIYKELNTVGSIMALVNWMREMNVGDRVELDGLLSVKIPAFNTPEETKKMLAVTAMVHPENAKITRQNVREYTKTYYLSNLLDEYSASTSDNEFLEIAFDSLSDDKLYKIYSPYKTLEEEINDYVKQINSTERELDLLDAAIEGKDSTLNIYSSAEVDEYNRLVDKYNNLYDKYSSLIEVYNKKVDELNEMNINARTIASIGGGISLNPREFKQAIINKDSPAIREVLQIKNQLAPAGNISKIGEWFRSNAGNGSSRINTIPRIAWDLSKSENGKVKYDYKSESGDIAIVEFSKDMKNIEYKIQVNDFNYILIYSRDENILEVSHSGFLETCVGEVSADDRHVVFSR
jgi:hypothetical protein